MESNSYKPDFAVQHDADPANDLQIVFYQPNRPHRPFAEAPSKPQSQKRWMRYADQIWMVQGPLKRIQVSDIIAALPESIAPVSKAASLLGERPELDQRINRPFLQTAFCDLLYTSGQAIPEDLDAVLKEHIASKSSNTRYLDKLKRGSRIANSIVVEWARRGSEASSELVSRLDRATHAVLQGTVLLPRQGSYLH